MNTLRRDAGAESGAHVPSSSVSSSSSSSSSDSAGATDEAEGEPPRWPIPWPGGARITTSVIAVGTIPRGTPDPLSYQQTPQAGDEPSAGQLIRFLRRHLRISQATLARRMGYSQQQVSNWEHNIHPLTSGVHRMLMEVLLEAHEREERRYEQLRAAQSPQQTPRQPQRR